jgi:hypothetical protein
MRRDDSCFRREVERWSWHRHDADSFSLGKCVLLIDLACDLSVASCSARVSILSLLIADQDLK